MTNPSISTARRLLPLALVTALAACAQAPSAPEAPKSDAPKAVAAAAPAAKAEATDVKDAKDAKDATAPVGGPLEPLAWLAGCWHGSVNQRDFREHWLPLRSDGTMIGASQTVQGGRMQDFEYLRLERRDNAVYYVTTQPKQKEMAFRLGDVTTGENGTAYPFVNGELEFPTRIEYRRGTEGWLYVTVEGTSGGKERKVIYPMRRVDCETGEFIRQ